MSHEATTILLFIAATFAIGLPVSIIVLAFKVKGMYSIDVHPNITVQAPTALIPESVSDTLRRLDEKLQPPRSMADDETLTQLVEQAVTLADSAQKGLKGPDKFRIARQFVEARAREKNIEVDTRALALRIEATVAMRRVARTQKK